MKVLRSILAVFAGMVAWAVLWLASNAALAAAMPDAFAEDGSTQNGTVLVTMLIASVVFSIAAGWLTALVARRREIAHTVALGVVQLGIGVAVQMAYWDVMPLWYHLPFLVLLVPGNVLGGWIRQSKSAD